LEEDISSAIDSNRKGERIAAGSSPSPAIRHDMILAHGNPNVAPV